MKTSAFLFLLFCMLLPGIAHADLDEHAIAELKQTVDEFGVVEPGFLYRGAQPPPRAFKMLRDAGIRTIINFRHEPDVIAPDEARAKELGLNYISIPWRIQTNPEENVMREFLDHLDKDESPFFIHCRRGAERTGVADAIYRHYRQHLSKDEAWKKAIEPYDTRFYWMPFIKWRLSDFYETLDAEQGT